MFRVFPSVTQSKEFEDLGNLGFTGSLNDRQFKYLRDQGFTGALNDMLYQSTLSTPFDSGVSPNGTFDNADTWTLAAGHTVSGGVLSMVGPGIDVQTPIGSPLTGNYRVLYTLTEVTGTGNQVRFQGIGGTTATGLFRNTPGTYEEVLTFSNVVSFRLTATVGTNCKLDNFGVYLV